LYKYPPPPPAAPYYQVDLDPTHAVIRLTVIEEMVSLECAESCYQGLSRATSTGGPYAAIYDLTRAKDTTIPTEMVRGFARRSPSIPTGRPHVVVGKFPVIYGLARLFQMCGESVGKEFEVVHTLEEAYEIVGARPEDFTVCLLPERPRGVTANSNSSAEKIKQPESQFHRSEAAKYRGQYRMLRTRIRA
jgi:hypothetical protein